MRCSRQILIREEGHTGPVGDKNKGKSSMIVRQIIV